MATLKISGLSVGDWVALEGADLKIEHGDIATAFVEEVHKPICVQSILGEDKIVFARTYHLEGYGTIYAKEEHLRPSPSRQRYWKRMDGAPMECTHFCALMNIATSNITAMNTACASIIAEKMNGKITQR